jgi:endoglucanase
MFFAVHFNDRQTFDRLWGWTQHNLRRAQDGLSAWRYDPHSNLPVSDPNNATDGDIYIAWALARAAERWDVPEYRAAATRIAEDILKCCVAEVNGRTILLPGSNGFRSAEGTVINLSYYAFPALRALSRLVVDWRWSRLERDGLAMIQEAGFGRWRLPPDWLLIRPSGVLQPAPAWPAYFSWDAIRVPLNLAWLPVRNETIAAIQSFWTEPEHRFRPPAWVCLITNRIPPYAGHAGVRAVIALASRQEGDRTPMTIRVADASDYYGAALILQARIAATSAPEPPATEPREAAPSPSMRSRLSGLANSLLGRVIRAAPIEREGCPEALPVANWSRERFLEAEQVRGVQPGLRNLSAPR